MDQMSMPVSYKDSKKIFLCIFVNISTSSSSGSVPAYHKGLESSDYYPIRELVIEFSKQMYFVVSTKGGCSDTIRGAYQKNDRLL
jgi:hypothetical protein